MVALSYHERFRLAIGRADVEGGSFPFTGTQTIAEGRAAVNAALSLRERAFSKKTAAGSSPAAVLLRQDTYFLQVLPQQQEPSAPDRSQPIRPMYTMELRGLEVMAQVPVEQPTR